MKKRLGGLLAIALGAVLIGNGLTAGGSGNVGVVPGTVCGSTAIGALTSAGNCPIGAVQINDTTPTGTGVPTEWKVKITSTCLDPSTGLPVDVTLTVPANTTGDSRARVDLYIFTAYGATASSPKCSYTLTRELNPQFTATFDPASPVTIPFSDDDNASSDRFAQVKLVNAAVVATTSAAPTSSTPASSSSASGTASAPASASASETGSVGTPVDTAAPASDSLSAAPIAETGPKSSIPITLGLGIGLVLLGLFLVFEGRVRRLAKHRG